METLPGHAQRVPPGREEIHAQLTLTQRERILEAMAETVAKRGYRGANVERVVKKAGVARVTFYEHFDNLEACLIACFDTAAEEAGRRVRVAAEDYGEWPDQVRAGLGALLRYIEEEPSLARTCFVEMFTAGVDAKRRYDEGLQIAADALLEGRKYSDATADLPDTVEESIVGGIAWMIHNQLIKSGGEDVYHLAPVMLTITFGPYLGEARAAELSEPLL